MSINPFGILEIASAICYHANHEERGLKSIHTRDAQRIFQVSYLSSTFLLLLAATFFFPVSVIAKLRVIFLM